MRTRWGQVCASADWARSGHRCNGTAGSCPAR
jgi:hypothetical protein